MPTNARSETLDRPGGSVHVVLRTPRRELERHVPAHRDVGHDRASIGRDAAGRRDLGHVVGDRRGPADGRHGRRAEAGQGGGDDVALGAQVGEQPVPRDGSGLVERIPHQLAAWLAAQLPDAVLARLARVANRYVDRAIRAMVHDPESLPPEVVAAFVAEARRPGSGMGYARYNQATLGASRMRGDLSGIVDRITAPTLLFHGEQDRLVALAGSRRAADAMPRARLVAVPECGHWAQLEAADRFRDELVAFLDAHGL